MNTLTIMEHILYFVIAMNIWIFVQAIGTKNEYPRVELFCWWVIVTTTINTFFFTGLLCVVLE